MWVLQYYTAPLSCWYWGECVFGSPGTCTCRPRPTMCRQESPRSLEGLMNWLPLKCWSRPTMCCQESLRSLEGLIDWLPLECWLMDTDHMRAPHGKGMLFEHYTVELTLYFTILHYAMVIHWTCADVWFIHQTCADAWFIHSTSADVWFIHQKTSADVWLANTNIYVENMYVQNMYVCGQICMWCMWLANTNMCVEHTSHIRLANASIHICFNASLHVKHKLKLCRLQTFGYLTEHMIMTRIWILYQYRGDFSYTGHIVSPKWPVFPIYTSIEGDFSYTGHITDTCGT
jgi:hypothetical protein